MGAEVDAYVWLYGAFLVCLCFCMLVWGLHRSWGRCLYLVVLGFHGSLSSTAYVYLYEVFVADLVAVHVWLYVVLI